MKASCYIKVSSNSKGEFNIIIKKIVKIEMNPKCFKMPKYQPIYLQYLSNLFDLTYLI